MHSCPSLSNLSKRIEDKRIPLIQADPNLGISDNNGFIHLGSMVNASSGLGFRPGFKRRGGFRFQYDISRVEYCVFQWVHYYLLSLVIWICWS